MSFMRFVLFMLCNGRSTVPVEEVWRLLTSKGPVSGESEGNKVWSHVVFSNLRSFHNHLSVRRGVSQDNLVAMRGVFLGRGIKKK